MGKRTSVEPQDNLASNKGGTKVSKSTAVSADTTDPEAIVVVKRRKTPSTKAKENMEVQEGKMLRYRRRRRRRRSCCPTTTRMVTEVRTRTPSWSGW